jgi:uncharacterized glyoxalase superfamily protein PhnB
MNDITGLVPYVFCADAGATADWCVEVLGFTETGRWTNKEGIVTNVDLTIGPNEVWLDGPEPSWQDVKHGLSAWIGLIVPDADAKHRELRNAGREVGDLMTRFGVRQFTVTDPEGHTWGFMTRVGS